MSAPVPEHRFDPEVTDAVTDIVRDWPSVNRGKIFGHPGFFAGPFMIQGSPTRGWTLVPAPEVETVLALGPWLHDAYEAALELAEREGNRGAV